MSKRERLEQAIAHMEGQRTILGDAVVDAALGPMRRQLAELEEVERRPAPALEGERKLVTIMFADISGFTALAERMDPEAVRDMMNGCFQRLVPIVDKYGGTVDKFIGDEIMALFGAPVAHENDPERALRAALDMMDALAAFNGERGTDLGTHFGINTGLVIAGGIGTDERQEYSVMGDAVNLASRLEDVSEQGEILVGPDTYRPTTPLFEFETLEPVRVKGKAEPVEVYRLVGLKTEPGRVRGLEARGISSPLVGRDAEFAAVKECVTRVLDGQGGIISIIGEAGVGKSRLMAEVLRSAQNDGRELLWLEGRTLSFGQTISYWPFQEVLWQWASIAEDDSEAQAWHKLEGQVSALFPKHMPEILPYLATLLSLEVRDEYVERVKYLDSEAMGRQVFLTSRRLFERLAREQPLVLVFEDLHWVDESSALLLEHLLPLVERVPLLICGVSRPYRETPAAHMRETAAQDFPDCYIEIELTPLSQTDSAKLVRNLLKIEDLLPPVREMIIRKAEGNPFFLEEIIRALIDAGAVVHDPASGRWQATAQIETVTVPDTVQGVIMARVDRLDDDLKGTLRTAAVIGRSFLYRVLRTVAEADRQLDQHLVKLQAIELIREKQRVPELEYIFKHALAQEATYESILLQRRRELHAQVAQAIEMLFTDRLEEFYSLLAYHYARSEAWEKAQEYLLKAGDQAGRVAADAEALAHYRQAMAAYGRAFGDRWDPVQRATLEHKIGEALFRRGEHQQALDHLELALTYLGKPLPTSRFLGGLVILQEIVRQIGHRRLPGLFLRSVGRPVSPVVEEEQRLYELIGWIDVMTNPERFLLVSLKGLNTCERSGFSYGIAVGSAGLAAMFDFISFFRLAESYHRWAASVAARTQYPPALGLVYLLLGLHTFCMGELDATVEYRRQAAEIFQKTGDLHAWGNATYDLVATFRCRGDFTQGIIHSWDVIQLGQEGGDPQVWCWGLYALGSVQLHIGRLQEASANLEKAVKLAEAIPDHAIRVTAGGDLGRCYLHQGRLGEALDVLEVTHQYYIEHKTGWETITPFRNGLAEAHLLTAEQSHKTEKTGWMKKARRSCQDALKRGKAFRPGLPEAMRLQGTYKWLRDKPAAARKWWQCSLALAEKQGQPYDLGTTHLEIGRRLGDRTHLEQAEAIFAEIGAEWDLARAREALEGVPAT
jgi:class 3 adenylate cyclase/tetratricopeptide (TPR) repeat protein